MAKFLEWSIFAAHFSVYVVAAINIWIFSHRSHFYKTTVKLRSLPLVYSGFASIAIGASYEIAEHIGDNWIYVSRLSGLNQLFYSFISGGICLIALGLRRSRITDMILLASLVLVPITYGVQGGKEIMQLAQLPPAIIFVIHWYWVMRDWRVFLYPLLANVIATGFGIALIASGNQIFHLFVGPSSALGLLILGYVAWTKPNKVRDNHLPIQQSQNILR
ncbi:MAG: hypothetical protein QNJ46_24805 [Leptolyngbyaceae cyanobacterium MO_188.B28]|nr:hypothetical protein [Leptolyngbyaceae cyanobacterium MO_188.B28]